MNNIEKLAEREAFERIISSVLPNSNGYDYLAKYTTEQFDGQYVDGSVQKSWLNFQAYAQQQSEPVARLIADPMLLPALKAPYIDWKVDPITLELDTDLFTHPPATVPLEKYNKLLEALNSPYALIEIDANKETISVVDKPSHITVEVFTKHQISQALKAIAEAEEKIL